ncbi:hypothetical protein RY831_02770 [Noviherbaspirillum sp. CPCC 100848]|uniref:Uncharacterized protein n=1 Tax=Noviherbaspirillum album TaxID=3080276 RepID=A0ABU6J351_9BURK|nr:hypothetical protein [Noviherbaspirillum sp. CPCC 100848]MEC4718059.1 hypothetical protein [Noviherbaspirillum sp. CPCC 100848]
MNSTSNNNTRGYIAPSSLAPQIAAYQKQYYISVLLGAILCGIITFAHLALFGDPKSGGLNPLPTLFSIVAVSMLVLRPVVTRSDRLLKSQLLPFIGNVPAEFGTILAAARTIDDSTIQTSAKNSIVIN